MNVLGTRKKCYRKEKCDISLHNVSIHRNFYQNQFINESVRKGLVNAKIG